MEQIENLLVELLKQMGVGLNYSKMYPPGHPAFTRLAEQFLEVIKKFPTKYKTLSIYFFENIILFEETRMDISKIPAILSLSKQLSRYKIESVSIDRDVTQEDIKGFFEVFTLPAKKFLETQDPTEFLLQKNIEKIRFNEVKFTLSSSTTDKEIKFDLESVLKEIENTDNPLNLIKSIPGEDMLTKTKNLFKNAKKINPLQLSKIFSSIMMEGGENLLSEFLKDEEIKNKIREIMVSMDESDFLLILSEIPREKRSDILSFVPEDKRKEILNKIPSFLIPFETEGVSAFKEEKDYEGIVSPNIYEEVRAGSEIEEKIDKIFNKIEELKDEEKEKEIRDIFLKMVGIDLKEDFDSSKILSIVSALKIVAYYLLEKYGEEGFSGLSLIVSQILKILSPSLKRRFLQESEKHREIAQSIRKVLEEMKDEELISLLSGIKEGDTTVPDTIKDILEKRKVYTKSEISYQDKELEMLERVTREKRLVITGEKKLKFMEKELEEGIGASEMDLVLEPLLEKLNKGDENERSSAVSAIAALAVSFIKSDKLGPLEKLINLIKSKIQEEEHPAVIFSYIDGLEKIVEIAKIKGKDFIVEDIQKTFRDLLDSESKKKMAIRALGKVGTQFALRMLLTALWDEDTEIEVKEALLSSGKEGFNALKEIFPEIENIAIRRRIAKILAAFPPDYRKEFYEALEEENWKTQRDIVFILGESKDEEGLPLLVKFLKTGQDIVRLEVLRALSKINNPKVEDDIIEVYIEYPGKEVKIECIRTLLKIGTEKSVDVISKFIKETIEKEDFNELVIPAFNFVMKHSPEKVYPFIEKILFEKTFLKKPKYPSGIRTELVRVLSKYKTEKIKSYLEELIKDSDSSVKLAATMGLRRFESDRN
ncbi:MAG: hypothetical protein ABIM58_04300 [candidate division WOR-3 bacterium]